MCTGTAAVSAVDIYLGESVNLGGSCTSDYVYLFVTGPNLPSNGANPEDISEEVATGDPSSFVRVTAFNNRWSYTWDTKTAGSPDAGVYTVYAVESPSGRFDLGGKDYSVKTVRLVDPSITVSDVSSSGSGDDYGNIENQDETASGTEIVTQENTPVHTETVVSTENTGSLPETPAAGIPAIFLLLSIALSLIVFTIRGHRS